MLSTDSGLDAANWSSLKQNNSTEASSRVKVEPAGQRSCLDLLDVEIQELCSMSEDVRFKPCF